MFKRFTRISRYTVTAAFAMCLCWSAASADEAIKFEIPAQPAAKGLNQYAEQANLQIMFPYADVKDVETNEVVGEFDKDVALETLLAHTGLEVVYGKNDTATVRPISDEYGAEGSRDSGNSQPASTPVLMAQNQTSATQSQNNPRNGTTIEDDEAPVQMEEIVVTGTNLRGVTNPASPVIVFDRADIEASGYATVHQFMQTVPQNFGGGSNESGADGAASNQFNDGGGTGVNLRGLGNTSTLTLVDGRRVAPTGIANFTDIASIPTSVIERIDILTDGASAIYGSDAIGGVVNIILRDDFEGAETTVRYGTVTDGDHEEFRVSQAFGTNWNGGNAFVNVEYFDRAALDAADRDFAANPNGPQTLLPEVNRHSIYASARHDITENTEVFGQSYFNSRNSKSANTIFIPTFRDDDVEEYGATIGVEIDLARDWRFETSGTYGLNDFDGEVSFFDITRTTSFDQSVISFDAIADGPVFATRSGDIGVAVGLHYREEELSSSTITADRDVAAIFAELLVPLVGNSNQLSAAKRIDLSIAVRHEDFSDFGSSTNPKFGLVWQPADALTIRGTWGTSFRAPRLREINPTVTNARISDLFDPVLDATVPVLSLASLFNTDLQPEEATTWTAGIDIRPESLPGLDMTFTYFDIDFTDRIEAPFGLTSTALQPEFESFHIRNPTLAVVQDIVNQDVVQANFDTTDTALLSSIETILFRQPVNVSTVMLRGVDFSIAYQSDTQKGDLSFSLSGSYYFEWERQLVSSLPFMSQLNTVFNPTDLKLRGSVNWNKDAVSAGMFVNYVDESRNTNVMPNAGISSWTTVDLTFQYDTSDRLAGGIADNTRFLIGVTNLFDRDPPFVENSGIFGTAGASYDGTNANALGRFVSFQLIKGW